MQPRPFSHHTQVAPLSDAEREKIYSWIIELSNAETREHALLELRYTIH